MSCSRRAAGANALELAVPSALLARADEVMNRSLRPGTLQLMRDPVPLF